MTHYTFSKIIKVDFETAISKATEELKIEGFGVLTEIDVKQTFKNKLDIDFRKYKILGACNPGFAHQAIQAEPEIGSMLPCNVVVQETDQGVRVSAVDPVASMMAVENQQLEGIATAVREKLKRVIENL